MGVLRCSRIARLCASMVILVEYFLGNIGPLLYLFSYFPG